MRRRMYFLLPDVKRAKQVFRELLLARIEERHIHVLANADTPLQDLPEATLLQKSDAVHGLLLGLIVGGATGTLAGIIVLSFPIASFASGLGVVLTMAVLGSMMGAWVSGMIATDVPNPQLKMFMRAVDRGKVLMIVDIPKGQLKEIGTMVKRHHPEADMRGVDPGIPAFP